MKTIILSLLILIFQNCIAQKSETEFGLYFGNDFKLDSVTIFINGVHVAQNIELRNRMYDPKNLIIEQDKRNIIVMPYNGPRQVFKRIQIKNSILILDIGMNNFWKNFSIDLKKGKYLYARYKVFKVGWAYFKVLEITQETFPPLII